MGALDFQLGVKVESVYNTPVVVDRFYEYEESATPIKPLPGRTESNPMRGGSRFRRQSRVRPYQLGAEGTLEIDVMNKGFGWVLRQMFGNLATTGAGPFVHTGTEGTTSSLMGDSFTCQLNYPFHPAGTNQAFTFAGGKVKKWKLGNTVDSMLRASLDVDFASWSTATALATASYPSDMTPLVWLDGVVTIAGTEFHVAEVAIEVDNNLKVDRRFIRNGGAKKEPTPGQASGTFALRGDFDALTQFNRVHGTTIADLSAQIVATWAFGADTLVATIPAARFDDIDLGGDTGAIEQTLTGVIEFNGTDSGVTVAYTSGDATA